MPGYGHTINNQALEEYQDLLVEAAKRREAEEFVEELRDWYNSDRYPPGEGDRQVKKFYRSFLYLENRYKGPPETWPALTAEEERRNKERRINWTRRNAN
jgi:hypothetical protein